MHEHNLRQLGVTVNSIKLFVKPVIQTSKRLNMEKKKTIINYQTMLKEL